MAPRRFNGLIADQGFFSKRFKKEDAYLYKCLAEARLLCSEAKGVFLVCLLTFCYFVDIYQFSSAVDSYRVAKTPVDFFLLLSFANL